MAPPRFTTPFAPLNLSQADKTQLRETAASLVATGQQLFEKHLWQDNEKIDASRWSLVRKREDVRVFHDRRVGAATGNDRLISLVAEGSMLGTLHDAMYGMAAHTTDDMRIRTSYTHDTVIDNAVLETLVDPTDDEPFESMSVVWIVKGVPLLTRVVIKPGDTVFLIANGIRRLSNGERVGYNLMHYVLSDRTPPLPQAIRVNSSLLVMWRDVAAGKVQMFATLSVESPTVVIPLVVRAMADGLVTLASLFDAAQGKKLAWLVRQRDNVARTNGHDQHCCCVCASPSRSVRRALQSACEVCRGYTCSKCRVKRRISFFTKDRRLLQPKLLFCLRCLTDASRLDAAVCAQGEAAGYTLEFDLCGGSGERRLTWSSSILSMSFSSRVAGNESFWGRNASRHSTASADASMSSGSPTYLMQSRRCSFDEMG